MRLLVVLLMIGFAVFGALFGALNGTRIELDLYFHTINVPKGAIILLALLAGWLLGGLMVWLLRVPALRRQLRQARQHTVVTPARSSGTAAHE